jgi:alkylmercury lyase
MQAYRQARGAPGDRRQLLRLRNDLTFHYGGGFTVHVMTTTTPTLDVLVDALVGAFTSLTAEEQRLIVTAYRLLSEGAPVELAALAAAAGWTPERVEGRLRSWPGGAYLDGEGRLVGLWGMAVEAVSPHQALMGDRAPVWMWCALDPLFIMPVLGPSGAEVTSTSPTTGEPIHLSIGPDGVSAVEPTSAVVSFLLPDGPFDDDVRQSFCHFVHFFASPTAADAWTAQHPGSFWLPVSDAAEVGRRLAARAFAAASAD